MSFIRKLQSKIRVLIVDDSALVRKILRTMLAADPEIEIVGTAQNGKEAVEKTLMLKPDVVLLDVQMPIMDGLEALRRIMGSCPTKVIMFSALTKKDADITLKALELGAVDFVTKPGGPISLDIEQVRDELIRKIKTAVHAKIPKQIVERPVFSWRQVMAVAKPSKVISREAPYIAVAIASSTGGPSAVAEVLKSFPSDFPAAVFIVQHMPAFFTKSFAEHLDMLTPLKVKEAEDGDQVYAGHAYVAPGDWHMRIEGLAPKVRIRLEKGPRINFVRPSADPTMEDVARCFGSFSIGVVLTGMGEDGKRGVQAIKSRGGYVIAQDQNTSVVFGMPQAAIESGCVDAVLPIDEIGNEIVKVVMKMNNQLLRAKAVR
ncbi:MAG: chemotaxis response regulator protein-glutamate methylesterase [Thermoprotei archaeon]|nr:MAG: chemotaxis response regulator protein-glutamate methylesterase [Thermoprotei archaeon]